MNVFPSFYDPKRIGTLFHPDMIAIGSAAQSAQLVPAAGDRPVVHLVLVDMQVDFCHAQGSLNVPGALGDIRRVIEFVYRYAERITSITSTLDSHLPFQIFHPAWWVDSAGRHPAPFTLISAQEVAAGRWRPLVKPEYSLDYVRQLEAQAKKQLVIWPFHVLLGSLGHALDSELWSAITWHALARQTQPAWVIKGTVPETEYYSAIQPEIVVPDQPGGSRNRALLLTLARADYVVVAGEAESHCILETVEDLVDEWHSQPERLQRLIVLSDCMSPVIHPQVDFHALAVEHFKKFEALGVRFLNSTDGMPFAAGTQTRISGQTAHEVVGLGRMGEWQVANQTRAGAD